MAREVSESTTKAKTQVMCDHCFGKKGRNARVVHELSFSDDEAYRQHLRGIYGKQGEDDGWIKSCIGFYNFVHRYYGLASRDKYQPVWLTYLEATGVTVRNRSEAIMRFRGRRQQGNF